MSDKNKILKIAAIVVGIGLLASAYLFLSGAEERSNCCEVSSLKPSPLICRTSADCELRGKDEWESCTNKLAPLQPEQEGRAARDQTSKSQEGYSCGCVTQQCAYFKP
jgi:hypothetical protein